MSTVAHDDWYSHWCTCRSEYSMFSGRAQTFALDGAGERGGDIEVERVAEFVRPGGAAGFDPGRQVPGVVTAEAGFSQ